MRAVILADRLGEELLPLTDNTCVALLPVAGRAVIAYTLDLLAAAGINRATVVLAAHADQVRTLLGDGERWGLAVDYLPSEGEEDPATLAQRLAGTDTGDWLWIRGDMLRGAKLAEFLSAAAAQPEATRLDALMGGQFAGFSLCRTMPGESDALRWPLAVLDTGVDIGGGAVHRLDSFASYHRAHQEAAVGRIEGLRLPGQTTAPGVIQGRRTHISPRCLKAGTVFIGNACRVDERAELSGVVVIADSVIIDRGARLVDTVVLSRAYLGEGTDLRNAIVRGNDVLWIDSDSPSRLTDTLLAQLRQTRLGGRFTDPLNRLAGLALLLASLPLWPLAWLTALAHHAQAPLRSYRLRGNHLDLDEFGQWRRLEFTAHEWATTVPVLRHLPRIWAVVTGDLRLIGVEPVPSLQAASRTEEWESLVDKVPAGLLGPTQLRLGAKMSSAERLMSDAFYAAQRVTRGDGPYLLEALRALFSRRAWLAWH